MIVIKFETKHFWKMSIYCTILESPQEGHKECNCAKFIKEDLGKCHSYHENDNSHIEKSSLPAAYLVYDESYEEATQDLSYSKEDHGYHCLLELECLCVCLETEWDQLN